MIGGGLEGIKSSTSMISKTVKKLASIFSELDFFSKFKQVGTYLLTGFHNKNKFSLRDVLIRKTFLEMILGFFFFFKYIFNIFIIIHCYYHSMITIVFQIFIIALLL